jgi:hypothetical protein
MLHKENTFAARIAKNAVVTATAGAFVLPHHGVVDTKLFPRGEAGVVEHANVLKNAIYSTAKPTVYVPSNPPPDEWTPKLEKEFRALALQEVKGTLAAESRARLDELNWIRDTLQNPRPTEEILLQLRRDRVLDKITEALEEYAEFYESANQKGQFTS